MAVYFVTTKSKRVILKYHLSMTFNSVKTFITITLETIVSLLLRKYNFTNKMIITFIHV